MDKLRKAGLVLRDNYRSMSFPQFLGFLRLLLFRNDDILIYSMGLERRIMESPVSPVPAVIKGQAADLVSERQARAGAVPWELQCDVYDGVRDFFVYTENGRLGHISWLYYRNDPNRILRLDDAECEIKFCLTFPEFRGKGLYPAALRVIQYYLTERGFRRCFICVKADNAASIRGIEKAGFRRAGAMRLRKLFGVQVTRPRPTAHMHHIIEDQRWTA